MNPHTLGKVVIIAIGMALGSSTASAALVLTVNTMNRTLTWSGTATSQTFTVPEGQGRRFILGFGEGEGGYLGGEDGFTATSSSAAFLAWTDYRVRLNTEGGYLMILLGDVDATLGSVSGTVTVSGNNETFLYSEDDDLKWSVLESLHGTELFFQEDNLFEVSNFGPAAGTIAVIPEPSTVALLMGGLSALLVLRRRKKNTA